MAYSWTELAFRRGCGGVFFFVFLGGGGTQKKYTQVQIKFRPKLEKIVSFDELVSWRFDLSVSFHLLNIMQTTSRL